MRGRQHEGQREGRRRWASGLEKSWTKAEKQKGTQQSKQHSTKGQRQLNFRDCKIQMITTYITFGPTLKHCVRLNFFFSSQFWESNLILRGSCSPELCTPSPRVLIMHTSVKYTERCHLSHSGSIVYMDAHSENSGYKANPRLTRKELPHIS